MPGAGQRPDPSRQPETAQAETAQVEVIRGVKWWAEQGSNLRPRPCKGRALPAELSARARILADLPLAVNLRLRYGAREHPQPAVLPYRGALIRASACEAHALALAEPQSGRR